MQRVKSATPTAEHVGSPACIATSLARQATRGLPHADLAGRAAGSPAHLRRRAAGRAPEALLCRGAAAAQAHAVAGAALAAHPLRVTCASGAVALQPLLRGHLSRDEEHLGGATQVDALAASHTYLWGSAAGLLPWGTTQQSLGAGLRSASAAAATRGGDGNGREASHTQRWQNRELQNAFSCRVKCCSRSIVKGGAFSWDKGVTTTHWRQCC